VTRLSILASASIACVASAVGYYGATSLHRDFRIITARTAAPGNPDIRGGGWADRHLLFVYIGSSTCAWSEVAWLPITLDSIRAKVRERADTAGLGFVSLGVALDWNPNDGVAHLSRIGMFDEIAAGYNWMNLAALKFLWSEFPGRASTPQVLVLYRELSTPNDGGQTAPRVVQEKLLSRAVGTIEIRRWQEHGIPVRGGTEIGLRRATSDH